MSDFQIQPQGEIRSGFPISVFSPARTDLQVEAVGASTVSPFRVYFADGKDGLFRAEFTIATPGHYRLRQESRVADVQIIPQRYLSFGEEFGLFALVVILVVGGMLQWLSRRKGRHWAG